ncbi:MAG TPA: hypothetical protein VGG04_00190 [Candidatus Sulfotelmatobacter sp.]|jgi:hypothetical protein
MRARLFRYFVRFLSAVGVVAFLLGGAIHLEQHLLRLRAERLLSEIRSLELRQSTFSDAQKIVDEWSSNARDLGPCRQEWCDVEITLNRNIQDRMEFLWKHPTLITVYRWLGGRAAAITASIRVRRNLVVRKAINEYVDGECGRDDQGQIFCVTMMGHVGTDNHGWVSSLHPEYRFWTPSGCEICVDASVTFTAYANPEDVRRLTDLNFGCITNWRPCETQQDILPTAWKQVMSEKEDFRQTDRPCTPGMIRAISRDLRKIPLAQVIQAQPTDNKTRITVRMEGEIDPFSPVPRSHDYSYETPDFAFHAGEHVLAFGRGCLPVPANEENVRRAEEGVTEAAIDPADHALLPFGNINPPHIKMQ